MVEWLKNYNNKREIIILPKKNNQLKKTKLIFLDELHKYYYLFKLNKNI